LSVDRTLRIHGPGESTGDVATAAASAARGSRDALTALALPGENATFEVLRAVITRRAQHLERMRAARSRPAVQDDVAIAGNQLQILMELTQRNEPRPFDVTLIPLLLLADVDQIDVLHRCKLGGCDVVRIHWIAESFIVDEMCDRRPRPADCAIRIFLEAQRTKLHPQ